MSKQKEFFPTLEPDRLPEDDHRPSSGIDYSAELNPSQYEAVTTIDGPVLVVAGAGSGKTRTLVYRVAYLVDQGVTPESILLLTFTRKAASEMLSRASRLVGDSCDRVAGGTFHSLANILLRQWAAHLDYPNTFGVMDRGDMEEVLGQLRRQMELGLKDRRFPKRSTLATIISKAANKSLPIKTLLVDEYIHFNEYTKDIEALAKEYAVFKKENALFDFDDLLTQLGRLLTEDEEARAAIAGRYHYIMVDEYQDTNLVQAEIVYQLARDHRNVLAVGDDAQSIYSFRGASFKNIMKFPEKFPGTKIIRLEENYRSTQPILNVTNQIISQAREKYDKKLFTKREGLLKPHLAVVPTQMEQSLFVCRTIKELSSQGIDPSSMAVLFRAARHSFKLEVELARHNIEFVKYGGRRFLDAAHIKDMLAILRSVANPKDGVSLTRAFLLLEGIGPKNAAQIVSWIDGRRENLVALDEYPAKGKQKASLEPMARLFSEIAPVKVPLQERVDLTWNFYQPIMEARFDDHPNRLKDMKEFLTLARGYDSLRKLLTDVTLEPPNQSGPRAVSGAAEPGAPGVLTLSTVHSAKGLEWKVVFVIWAAEGRFPPPYALDSPETLDEERRLMYVAATRAEDQLYFICPREMEFESGSASCSEVSRFLADLPSELLHSGDRDRGPTVITPKPKSVPVTNGNVRRRRRSLQSPDPVGPSEGAFTPGMRVSHPVFGLGRVVRLMNGRKIRVDFDHFGSKTLHLEYAGLKKAG